MKNFKNIFLFIGVLITINSYCQNDAIIKKGYVNIATLIVDYDTYNFEGGDISYYSCSDCPIDSIPFTIDYDSPGDFGGVTFKLSELQDTVFSATIIWMGTGQIYYPNEFSMQGSFLDTNKVTNKPNDLRYIDTDGNAITDAYLLNKADSAWNAIDSLKITELFAENRFKSAIYLYPPSVGAFDPNVAKWIIFLYQYDQSNAINSNGFNNTHIQIFSNPVNGVEKINLNLKITNYRIFNSSGQLVDKGEFLSNVHQIDVTILNSGLYFLHLSDENNEIISTEKFIIE
jgi:hypothetical protein